MKGSLQKRAVKPYYFIFALLFSAAVALCAEICIIFAGSTVSGTETLGDYISLISSDISAARTAAMFAITASVCLLFLIFGEKAGDFIYRFRWPLGLAVILVAVIFEINGSSIGIWQSFVSDPTASDDGILLGQDRAVRSDEWAVHTPMTLSQYYTDFSVFGNIFRGTETDMYMVYGQPVMDWSIIFRPFQIGYLLAGPARGLSFYWVGKLVVLFLVSFEMGMLLSENNRLTALAYSAMTAFAPVVQWWFGTNSFPEMLIYLQAIILLLNCYMKTDKYSVRAACAVGFVFAGGAFVFVMYPAWQIPFFYIFLFVGIWVIIQRYKDFKFSAKKDIPIIAGGIIVWAALVSVIVLRSWDTVQAVMNSAYPGSRVETGGNGISHLFKYAGNLFLPYNSSDLTQNQSEMASFYSLFPAGAILSVFVLLKNKGKKDKLLVFMWILNIFFGVYVLFGFPELLAKLTLMSQSPTNRAAVALSFVNVILLIRSIALKKTGVKAVYAVPAAVVSAVGVSYCSRELSYGEYYGKLILAISIAVLSVIFFLAFCKGKRVLKTFCIALCGVSLVCGGLVNPVRTGLGQIEENRLCAAIQQVQQENPGIWVTENISWVEGNFTAMNGAPTINSTSTYCNTELWEKLDPQGENEYIYNRYAHTIVNLVLEGETSFALVQSDLIRLCLSIDDLENLGVNYIFTTRNLDETVGDNCRFECVYSQSDLQWKIYRVVYFE